MLKFWYVPIQNRLQGISPVRQVPLVKKNEPDLYVREGVSGFDQKLIDEGFEVEYAARQLFDKGILVQGTNEEALEETRKLIEARTTPIFQATFITESGLFAKTDVIIYNEFADT